MNILQNGLLDLPWFGIIAVTLVLTHITIASVTIFLHRHQSHGSLTLHAISSHFFRFWLWLTTGMVTKEWVAVHRKHHAKCETSEDPHSPRIYGIRKLLLQGTELYRTETKNKETLEKYGQGTPDDWLEKNVYSKYPFLGVILMLIADVLMFGVIGITVFAVQMLWIPVLAAGVINGIGHYFGYRNFETKDASRNIVPWGILIGGEELHNNHHAYATSARLSNKWWEFDIGWLYIKLMSFVGLAKVKKTAAKVHIQTDKSLIDMDTLRTLARHRFHVVKLYGRKVIRPVIREECRRANEYCQSLFRRVRKLMTREDIKLDKTALETIGEAVDQSRTLATVYEFKQNLLELWSNSVNNQAARLERLQEWCADAEKTGIKALEDFARFIRGYAEVKPAAAV